MKTILLIALLTIIGRLLLGTVIMMWLLQALHAHMFYIPALGFTGSFWIAILAQTFIWIATYDGETNK